MTKKAKLKNRIEMLERENSRRATENRVLRELLEEQDEENNELQDECVRGVCSARRVTEEQLHPYQRLSLERAHKEIERLTKENEELTAKLAESYADQLTVDKAIELARDATSENNNLRAKLVAIEEKLLALGDGDQDDRPTASELPDHEAEWRDVNAAVKLLGGLERHGFEGAERAAALHTAEKRKWVRGEQSRVTFLNSLRTKDAKQLAEDIAKVARKIFGENELASMDYSDVLKRVEQSAFVDRIDMREVDMPHLQLFCDIAARAMRLVGG